MDNFDLICTATLRPELLKRTFDSHIEHLFKENIKKANLICNIDLVGNDERSTTLRKIDHYFHTIPFNSIQINVCENPHFSRAFNWCLGQISSPLTFNLEEDWELLIDLDFERMVELFKEQNDLAHLRLSFFDSKCNSEVPTLKQWNQQIGWSGDYFEVPRSLRGVIGWCGHPSLNKTAFLLAFATIMDRERNHEKQIKGPRPILMNSRFGVYHPLNTPKALVDIGKDWKKKHGFQKKGENAFFTQWEKV